MNFNLVLGIFIDLLELIYEIFNISNILFNFLALCYLIFQLFYYLCFKVISLYTIIIFIVNYTSLIANFLLNKLIYDFFN